MFNLTLQMTCRIINDLVNLNELILTLLMFETYLRMIKLNVFFNINQRILILKKVMNKKRKFILSRQINKIFNTRNELFTDSIHDFYHLTSTS